VFIQGLILILMIVQCVLRRWEDHASSHYMIVGGNGAAPYKCLAVSDTKRKSSVTALKETEKVVISAISGDLLPGHRLAFGSVSDAPRRPALTITAPSQVS
jgi:hypothetical protein